jgi:cytohesin
LIETKGADVNAKNGKDTPLQYALEYFNPNGGSNITVLAYLLSQKGTNGNIKGQRGYTLLHYACDNRNKFPLDIFKALIETQGCDVNVVCEDKSYPLHRALRYFDRNTGCDITVLTYLLGQTNVNVNVKDDYGYTLLHMACQKINELPLDIFTLLIEKHGADVNVQDNNKDTPLHIALKWFNPNGGSDITVLPYLLNQKDINDNIKGKDGNNLLHTACENINTLPLDIFKLLIETRGADVNAQNNNKNTPLHQAFGYLKPHDGVDTAVWAYLINQMNLNVNIEDQNGHTLLHSACICDITGLDDFMDSEDEFTDSDDDFDDCLKAKADTFLCQIVQVIAERCVQQVLDGNNLK